MASNINPSLTPVNSLTNFKFWCQKVLPLVYDDSLSYYEVLGKMVVQLNDVIDNVNADTENVLTLKDAFLELQTYVNNFFDDIDQLASYAERAEAAQTAANTSAVNAATSASNASASSLAAMDARDTAVTAKQAAETSANTASTAATNANTKANEAAQSAITAQTAQANASQSATLAATDRSAAQTAANTATTKANEASTSASNAETSAENASQSEANAEELVNNIQENLDNIQHNTQDISDLKTALTLNVIDNKIVENVIMNTNGGVWAAMSGYKFYIFQITPSANVSIDTNATNNSFYCFLRTNSVVVNSTPDYATNSTRTELVANRTYTMTAPSDANYIYIAIGTSDTSRTPRSVIVNGYELIGTTLRSDIVDLQTLTKEINTKTDNNTANFDRAITSNINILQYADIESGYMWNRNGTKSENASSWAYKPIPIKSGKTYYYKNIWAYYSVVIKANGTIVTLTTDTSSKLSGSYTADSDGVFCVTIGNSTHTDGIDLLTDSYELYNSSSNETYYKPNRLLIDVAGKVYHVEKDGSGDFTTFKEAINEACKYMDSTVYVGAGTFDLLDELGSTYLSDASSTQQGIVLKNRVHVIGSSKTILEMDYDGTLSNVKEYISPINTGEYGCTLENVTIIDNNVRYSIHDDQGWLGDIQYANKFINCTLIHKNGKYTPCIGGGLGENGEIEIRGCYLEGDSDAETLAYYHGNNHSGITNAKGLITVCDNYFAGVGTFKLQKYGDSTEMSSGYVSNNSFGTAPSVTTATGAQDNMRMFAWNNEVRA